MYIVYRNRSQVQSSPFMGCLCATVFAEYRQRDCGRNRSRVRRFMVHRKNEPLSFSWERAFMTQFGLDKVKDLLGTENIPGSPEELEVLTQWTQGLVHQKGEQYVRKCRKRLYKDWESIRRLGLSRI